jgi:predicted dehydrogenase
MTQTQKADGMNYAPQGKPSPVVKAGEFVFAAAHLDHGHIFGQCNGLLEAGAELKWVYDPDEKKVAAFCAKYPQAKVARSLDEILGDRGVHLVTAAAVPCDRGPIGLRVMEAGKDYFTDKTPFTSLDQLDAAKATVARTGRKYMVYFSERLHVESAMYATDLVAGGAIGRVIQVIGLGPHRLGKANRPSWFFEKAKFGGILTDIGSHQFEQFLTYTGAKDATVTQAAVGNFANPDKPEFEDFGEASLLGDNGSSKGYIELRKYVDVAREKLGDNVYIVDDQGERYVNVSGQVGFPFFGQLILDCLNRTEKAMTQAHAFKAAELCLRAQLAARRITA